MVTENPAGFPERKTAKFGQVRTSAVLKLFIVFLAVTLSYLFIQKRSGTHSSQKLSSRGLSAKMDVAGIPTETVTGRIKAGSTLFQALVDKGLPRQEANSVVGEINKSYDVRRVKAGDEFRLVQTQDKNLIAFDYHADPLNVFYVERHEDGLISGKREFRLETVESLIYGEVDQTVYQTILAMGESAQLASLFVNVFAWDFDFSTGTRKGDRFSMLVEKKYKDGRFFGYGKILSGKYESSFGMHTAVYYQSPEGTEGYYSPEGRSMKKAFLRSPLRYDYITSGFTSWRFHPVLRRGRPHYAIDYGARPGTPVWSVADGLVIYAGWKGPAGRTVIIRHANQYVTSYSHLSRMARGVRVGARVRQQQVIGYVGSSGLTTGPHLHYMLKIAGRFVNPQRVKFPPGTPVAQKYRKEFDRQKDVFLAKLEDAPKVATIARPPVPFQ